MKKNFKTPRSRKPRSVDQQKYIHTFVLTIRQTIYELNSTLFAIFLIFHTKVYLFRDSNIFMSMTMCGCLHKRAQKYIYEAQILNMQNISTFLVRLSINVSLHGYQYVCWKITKLGRLDTYNSCHSIFHITSM